MKQQRIVIGLLVLAVLLLAAIVGLTYAQGPEPPKPLAPQVALGTAFTYQGQLEAGGEAVDEECDFQFTLHDTATLGSQIGVTQSESISVTAGLFTAQIDFGPSAFTGDARWLGIRVKCPTDIVYTDLGRQELAATPYAMHALTAPWGGLTGVPAGFADGNDGVDYQNVIVVAKSGGDFTSIQAALDSITGTVSNRYLVWIAPGTYTETVTMEEYVDIEGSGEMVTKITYTGSTTSDTGTVVGADNAELRFLTVENTGGNNFAIAIYNNVSSPRLTHMTASASGGTMTNYGVHNYNSSSPTMTDVTASTSGGTASCGVFNYDYSSPTMTGVTASALGGTSSNYGVYSERSSLTIQNSTLSASGGTNSFGIYASAEFGTYTVTVRNSLIAGSTNTIFNIPRITTLVGASLMSGGPVDALPGTITCAGVYDEDYTFYANTCP